MEKVGFIKVLDEMKENDIHIYRLTTDRHMQIRKYTLGKRKIPLATSSTFGILVKTLKLSCLMPLKGKAALN